jgi:hypothetical protein
MSKFLKLILLRYLPSLAMKAFAAKRIKEDPGYWSVFKMYRYKVSRGAEAPNRPRLLIVLPAGYDGAVSFEPSTGNYNYELFRSAKERYGGDSIELFPPTKSNDWVSECRLIADRVSRHGITHLLFYIESNEAQSGLWRWDILAGELTRSGSSVTAIGFLTDGTYELHQIQCSRFLDVYPNSVFIQIDIVPSFKYLKPGRLLGPTFLPISLESITRIGKHLRDAPLAPGYELSFIGKLYGYRKRIVKTLLSNGLEVAINPQAATSGTCRASYLDYLSALSRSRYTINFARANGTRQKQLKSRILESVLVGSIPVTDDNGLTERILPKGVPFVSYRRPKEIPKVLAESSGTDGQKLESLQRPAPTPENISRLASGHFWETLEEGLSGAGLPNLAPLSETSRKQDSLKASQNPSYPIIGHR